MEQDLRGLTSIVMDSRTVYPVQTAEDGSLYLNGVKLVITDIPATNGIIHIISDVIPTKIQSISSAPASTYPLISLKNVS